MTAWTGEQTKQLLDMAAQGYPGSSIAKVLGCTRGAVMGRCSRLGIKLNRDLARRGKPKKANRVYPKKKNMVNVKLGKPGPIFCGFRG